MIRNYLKITLRNILKYKAYLGINVLGLTVALACSILALAFINDELSFDKFHTKKDRLYRLNKRSLNLNTGVSRLTAENSGLMGPTILDEYPEVENITRVCPWWDDVVMSFDDKNVKVSNFLFVDSTFFDLFDFKLIKGDRNLALVVPSSVIITEDLADKLFGNADPIGQTVIGLQSLEYHVTGVVENPPRNSHLQYDALVSWTTTVPGTGPLPFTWMNNWWAQAIFTYVLTNEGADVDQLQSKLTDFMQRNFPERADQYFLYLQPFQDIYLNSSNLTGIRNARLGSGLYIKIFSFTAIFLLLIACINYININTAKATKRAREVGIRKVMGASRKQLLLQFFGESLLITLLSGLLALLLADLAIPAFNDLAGRHIQIDILLSTKVLIPTVGIIAIVSIVAGTYPALVLSSFSPAKALRSSAKSKITGNAARQVLTTFQFAISVMLITGTILVFSQMEYLNTKDLGFAKDQVLVLNIENSISSKYQTFQNEIESHPDVISTAAGQAAIGSGTYTTTVVKEGDEDELGVRIFRTDGNFIKTYGMEIVEGRDIDTQIASDSNALIVNEAFVNQMGWKEPLNQQVQFNPLGPKFPIIGVVKDFHYNPLTTSTVGPIAMFIWPSNFHNLSVRITGKNIPETLSYIESIWNNFESRFPFEYYFVDQWFNDNYKDQQQLFKTVSIFSLISILIACLGLYGLTSFTIEQRTKEIGIRKVFGASVSSIATMINKKFILLVGIGFLIASPFTYYLVDGWLESFVYRIPVYSWAFIVGGLIVSVIAILSVSIQALKAAMVSPIKSLSHE